MKLFELSEDKDDIILHEEAMNLWEMANLRPKDTGIDNCVIWISSGEAVKYGPRIKVAKGLKWDSKNNATIPLTGMPRVIGDVGITQDDFSKIVKWIGINKEALMQFWNSELSTKEILDLLKKI